MNSARTASGDKGAEGQEGLVGAVGTGWEGVEGNALGWAVRQVVGAVLKTTDGGRGGGKRRRVGSKVGSWSRAGSYRW